MEMINEKIEMVFNLCEIYLVGRKVFETVNKTEDFSGCLEHINELNLIIESNNKTDFQKSQFTDLS